MSKFHINKHGVPSPCRAKKGNCPLGGEGEHFVSKEEAQKYVNYVNEREHGLLAKAEKVNRGPFKINGVDNISEGDWIRVNYDGKQFDGELVVYHDNLDKPGLLIGNETGEYKHIKLSRLESIANFEDINKLESLGGKKRPEKYTVPKDLYDGHNYISVHDPLGFVNEDSSLDMPKGEYRVIANADTFINKDVDPNTLKEGTPAREFYKQLGSSLSGKSSPNNVMSTNYGNLSIMANKGKTGYYASYAEDPKFTSNTLVLDKEIYDDLEKNGCLNIENEEIGNVTIKLEEDTKLRLDPPSSGNWWTSTPDEEEGLAYKDDRVDASMRHAFSMDTFEPMVYIDSYPNYELSGGNW